MKKLFLMIVSAICGVLPFGKANARANTCTYTYSDGTTQTVSNCYCNSTYNNKDAVKCMENYGSSIREYEYDNNASTYYYECVNDVCNYKTYYPNYYETFTYDRNGNLIGGYDETLNCYCDSIRRDNFWCGCFFTCDSTGCTYEDTCEDKGCIYENGNHMSEDKFTDYACTNGKVYYDGDCQECYNATSCSYDRENDKWTLDCPTGYYQWDNDYECSECPDNAISCHYDEDYGEVVSECEEGYVSDYWGDCQECYNTTSCSYDREKDEWVMECSAGYYQTCTDDYSCCDNECPEGASSCYLEDMDDEDSMVIDSCNNGYLEKDGSCISATAGCGAGYRQFENFCNRIQYTPAEAAPLLNDDNNTVTITFRK